MTTLKSKFNLKTHRKNSLAFGSKETKLLPSSSEVPTQHSSLQQDTRPFTRKLKLTDQGFWPKWFAKLLFTLISVKVWGLIAGTMVSTWLLLVHLHNEPIIIGDTLVEYGINGAQWITFNTTIWALIFGMKEIFRVSEQANYNYRLGNLEKLEQKVALANILSGAKLENKHVHKELEYEIVESDPEESH